MDARRRPLVVEQRRLIIYTEKLTVPDDSLFPDLEAALLNEIAVLAGLKNKTQNKILDARQKLVHIIIESLFLAVKSTYVDACVALPTSNSAHARKREKGYGSHRTVLLLLDALSNLNWVEVHAGGLDRDSNRVVTTIVACGALKARLEQQPLVWRPISISRDAGMIEVRQKNHSGIKYSIDVPINNNYKRKQKILYEINVFLSKHAIALDLDQYDFETMQIYLAGFDSRIEWADSKADPKSVKRLTIPRAINLYDTCLYRIFSRGSLTKGGRHFRVFWQTIPKQFRNAITIDGIPTIELDYAELHPRLLYAQLDETPPDGDVYNILLEQDIVTTDKSDPIYRQKRKIIKVLVNALINDEHGTFHLKAPELAILGMTWQQVLYRLYKKHPLLKRFKGCGKGLEFQHIDSEVAERVMMKLMAQNIVCLPIFDSFRVQVGYETELRDAMIAAYQEVLGGIPEICDPELPREPEIMPEYPTTFHDDQGRPYKMIDQTYVKNHLLTHPHAIYLQGYFMCHPPSETP